MPHGVLFRGGKEAEIRQCLVESDQLEAVIGLPNNLFYSTSIPACILVFRAQPRKEWKGHVQFIDASACFEKGRNQNHMTTDHIETVVEAFRTGEDPDGEDGVHTRMVPVSEISDNGFDLNIGRYVRVAVDEVVDVETALKELREAQQELRDAEEAMWERLKEAGYA